jgi:hypothetical protein
LSDCLEKTGLFYLLVSFYQLKANSSSKQVLCVGC